MFNTGDLVVSLVGWEIVKAEYPHFKYPDKEQILTVQDYVKDSPVGSLSFQEDYYGPDGYLWAGNFEKVQTREDGLSLFEEINTSLPHLVEI